MTEKLNPMTFPLHGTRLIEASAGTGKTYTIAALYLRLVLGHGGDNGFSRPLTPPEILVVTFTNAATEELRERIRTRLTQGAAFFRGLGEGDAFLEALKDTYDPEVWPDKAMRLDQAAQWMDEAAIHTIHGWCQRMLRQHAFDSLSLFDLELAPSDADLLQEAVCDFWRARFYPMDPGDLAEFRAVAGISTPQDLLARVIPLINGNHAIPEPEGRDPFVLMEKRRAWVEKARQVWASDFETPAALVESARQTKILNNNKYRKPSLEKWTRAMDLWVNHGGGLPDDQTLEKFSAIGLKAGTAKNKQTPSHPAYDALDRLNSDLKDIDIKTALVCHGADQVRQRTETAKERLSRMGFNDLLTRLDKALSDPGSPGLSTVIHDQFPVAMIDEFQDTDPVQYRAFSTIYLDREEAGLFMIGDPKQAIYAFRGADIHTYLTARKDTKGRHYTLEKNYRSTQGMVAAVNRVFSRAAGFEAGAFLFGDDIPFDPVLVQGRPDTLVVEGRPQPPMTLWQADQDGPIAKTGPSGYVSQMAGAAAKEIARLINLGAGEDCRTGFQSTAADAGGIIPLKPSDMAVLVRDGQEARAVRKALEIYRVKSVYLSDRESVFDSDQALSLVYLLRACADPGNDGLVRTALAVPLLSLSFENLDRLNRDEAAWETEVSRFKEFRQIWQKRGVLPMVRALLSRFNVGARLLSVPGGERQMTNVLHLAEMLQTAAASLDGEQGLIRWLSAQIQSPQAGADDQIIRLESDDELVRVVTIHKSKGLEYPLVFLPFICSFRKLTARNTAAALYHDEKGRPVRVVNPDAQTLELADRERLAEDLRMLYVALTRPCYACWLGMGVMGKITKKSGETTQLHQSAVGHILAGGKMIFTTDLEQVLKDLKGGCEAIETAPLPAPPPGAVDPDRGNDDLARARPFSAPIPKNWRITSYSGILAGAAMDGHGPVPPSFGPDSPDSASQDQLRETAAEASPAVAVIPGARSIHTFPRGPEPGTFLHDILEWAAIRGFDQVAREPGPAMDEVARRCARRGWEDWTRVIGEWLMALVQWDMGNNEGGRPMRLADLGPDHCRAEMEFMFPAHGVDIRELDRMVTKAVLPGIPRPALRRDRVEGMLKGFIDLVFVFEGRYFVLDYKSNHLGADGRAYGLDAMALAMAGHRYDLQYMIYTLALHRLLKARLPGYEYDRDVGGAVYLFLRGAGTPGQGVYVHKPPESVILTLDESFRRKK